MRYLRTGPYIVEQNLSYKPAKSVAKQVMKIRPNTAATTSKPQRSYAQQGHRESESEEDEYEAAEEQIKVSGGEVRYVRILEENLLYKVLSDNITQVRRDLEGIKETNLPDDEPLVSYRIIIIYLP